MTLTMHQQQYVRLQAKLKSLHANGTTLRLGFSQISTARPSYQQKLHDIYQSASMPIHCTNQSTNDPEVIWLRILRVLFMTLHNNA